MSVSRSSTTWHVCADVSCFIDWADHWQTMITGVLALGAAGWAAWLARGQLSAARQQMKEARRQARNDRDGRLRAARASLPATLSAICDYAERVAAELRSAYPVPNLLGVDRYVPTFPPFPAETIMSLERVVELTADNSVAERIESILREAQVLDARCRGMIRGDRISADYLAALLQQAASIYARAESLFDYGRRRSAGVSTAPLWDRVFAAFTVFRLYEGAHDAVFEMAREARDQGQQPGEADTQAVY
jgi:hypothetical protein